MFDIRVCNETQGFFRVLYLVIHSSAVGAGGGARAEQQQGAAGSCQAHLPATGCHHRSS